MIITCEECSTRFALDDSLINPQGSKVRCSRCQHIFTAFPPIQETLEPESDTTQAPEFEEPDFSDSSDTPEDIPFDAPDNDQDLEMDFPEETPTDFDDEDIEFDGVDDEIEFDEIEFDEAPDFSEPDSDTGETGLEIDSDLEMDSEFDLDDSELEIEDTELEIDTELEMDIPEPEEISETVPGPEIKNEDLELGDDDLDLDSQDVEFDDLELIDDEEKPAESGPAQVLPAREAQEDFEDISVPPVQTIDEDPDDGDDGFNFDGISLAMEDPDVDEDELEEIEFEVDEDVDLELVFDDDPDADLVFDEDDEDDIEPALEMVNKFEEEPSPQEGVEELETDLEFDEESEFLMETDLPGEAGSSEGAGDPMEDSDKFTNYDAVLDQDPEPIEAGDEVEFDPDFEIPEEIPAETEEEFSDQEEDSFIDPTFTDAQGKRKRGGGIGAPVKIFFLLFLLVIAAYAASLKLGADIPFISDINIPYVTDALKPAPAPQPPLKPVPNEASINGRFLANTTAGELFIVTGRIDNPSTIAYGNIKVKGTLLTKEKTKAGTQLAYCGNIISEETLKSGNISDIAKQLTVKQGMQKTNVNIKPGGFVEFMLVFSGLPENLTNFTVEVVDFKPLTGKN